MNFVMQTISVENKLIKKFKQVIDICEQIDVDLVNLSPVESKINTIKKEQ
jgi:hypothetical protein